MIEQRKKERGSQIDGGTTTENAFLGYLAIMLCCKTEVAYREVAYSESVGRISANKCHPARQRLLAMDIANKKALSRQRLLGNVGSGGVADDVLPCDDVLPDLSFEDLERTFPRFSSLEGLGQYRI
ncbi:uncharacterized protein DS421_19g657330 [Arachis hypogaea]|uniref:Uncharacterized protein n=1 Tax=Arachis hypogaea TaxID=3818 RepID=A0A6B9V881_ARAHY|nr:uncharacterized protein DS421_19g657330 [Arachis hypogaea]